MATRKRRGSGSIEHHVDERWMASYMDMVTVLMCLFIVLFAMSSPSAEKYEKLKESLATGFGVESSDTIDTADGVIVPPDLVDEEGELITDVDLAIREIESLEAIRDQIDASLAGKGLAGAVNYTIDQRGLTVRLVGAETFFQGNSTDLSTKAIDVLSSIGGVIAPIPHEVSVEGHADPHGSPAPFPTDWELSSGRATQVVRFFVERTGVAQTRTGAVGFGSARPITSDASPAGQQMNRRVDVVILSDEPESVRALIPGLVNADRQAASDASHKAAEKEAEGGKKSEPKKESGGH
ncbi:OmpA/MotB family protein [Agromyces humi]|uniref:OmpA/MotB family protein n=1 Tax=Agromyces humi TaxID=1766800 RepID=UPI00135CA55E|nr:flagellar motor protein MotB [Agromyces humi]